SSVSGRPSFQFEKGLSSFLPRRLLTRAVRLMTMLTRGVCRTIPGFLGTALAEVTIPQATRPDPPSFSLAKMNIESPLAMCLPPYIVFCAGKADRVGRALLTSALIMKIILPLSLTKKSYLGLRLTNVRDTIMRDLR